MVHRSQEGVECYTFDQIISGSRLVEAWLKNAIWMRSFVQSTVWDLPNLPTITSRVAQVPIEFYNVLRPFWGERLAQQFTDLIGSRTAIKSSILTAVMRNDQNTADQYTRELYANADEISAFLAQFPSWSRDEWQILLYDDSNMFIRQIESLLNDDYNTEASIYERIINHTINMGNYMAYGILRRRIS